MLHNVQKSSHTNKMNTVKRPNVSTQLKIKAKEYRCDLRNDLKIPTLWAVLMCTGKLFDKLGATTEKARSPLFFNLALGTSRSTWLGDLSALTGVWICESSDKLAGANPCKILKTINKLLNSILKRTGSQCSEAKTGVMCSYFFVPVNQSISIWSFFRLYF